MGKPPLSILLFMQIQGINPTAPACPTRSPTTLGKVESDEALKSVVRRSGEVKLSQTVSLHGKKIQPTRGWDEVFLVLRRREATEEACPTSPACPERSRGERIRRESVEGVYRRKAKRAEAILLFSSLRCVSVRF